MPVILRPHIYKIRVLPEGASYGDPYCGVMLVTWQGPDVVEIDLAHGELTRHDVLDIYRHMEALGVRFVHAWRADRHRLPGGKPLRSEGRFTLYAAEMATAIPLLERACKTA